MYIIVLHLLVIIMIMRILCGSYARISTLFKLSNGIQYMWFGFVINHKTSAASNTESDTNIVRYAICIFFQTSVCQISFAFAKFHFDHQYIRTAPDSKEKRKVEINHDTMETMG